MIYREKERDRVMVFFGLVGWLGLFESIPIFLHQLVFLTGMT